MTVVIYLIVCVACLMAGAMVAQYNEKVRQAEEEIKIHENTNRQLLQELDAAKRKSLELERSVENLQEEKEKAEVYARELEIERDTMRRYFKQAMSPRAPNATTPVSLRAVHA